MSDDDSSSSGGVVVVVGILFGGAIAVALIILLRRLMAKSVITCNSDARIAVDGIRNPVPDGVIKMQHISSNHSNQFNTNTSNYDRDPILKLHSDTADSSSHSTDTTILASLPALRKKIVSEVSFNAGCTREWTLMFSTDFHGRSFPRLASAMACAKGPVLIIIEEERDKHAQEHHRSVSVENDGNDDDERSVFGGVTFSPWLNVRQREQNAKSSAAARARNERLGTPASTSTSHHSGNSNSNSNRAPQFFGESTGCFVWKLKNAGGNNPDDEIAVYQTRDHGSLANGNFQYYFDVHPSSESVGIGMGGSGARGCVGTAAGMSWFVDRSLVHGESTPGGCTTFQYSEQLSKFGSSFRVKRMEIWSLDPSTIGDGHDGLYCQYDADQDTGKAVGSALKSRAHAVDKALMQLNGMVLYSEREDIATDDCDRTGCRVNDDGDDEK